MDEVFWSLVAEGCVLVGSGFLVWRRKVDEVGVLMVVGAASALIAVGIAL